jgi:hypothetical protein
MLFSITIQVYKMWNWIIAKLKVTHWKNARQSFLQYTYKENRWSSGGAKFDPRAIILNNLGRGLLYKWRFHAKYLTFSLFYIERRCFKFVLYIHIRKAKTPWGIFTSANIWTTLVEDLLMIFYTKYLSSKP